MHICKIETITQFQSKAKYANSFGYFKCLKLEFLAPRDKGRKESIWDSSHQFSDLFRKLFQQ